MGLPRATMATHGHAAPVAAHDAHYQNPQDPPQQEGGCFLCCCFSPGPLSREELQKSGYKGEHPYCALHHQQRFQVSMANSCCKSPCCCLLTSFTCTYGTNWCLRREVIEADWNQYHCCQGFTPCSECLESCLCCEGDGRCCCMCLECLCCPGLAISATRIQLMHEFALAVDPCDNQIIRFNNCMQLLACVCDIAAICFKPARDLARIIDLIAHLVFMATAGCMAAQIHHEKQYQLSLVAEGSLLPPGQQHSAMGDNHHNPVAPVYTNDSSQSDWGNAPSAYTAPPTAPPATDKIQPPAPALPPPPPIQQA